MNDMPYLFVLFFLLSCGSPETVEYAGGTQTKTPTKDPNEPAPYVPQPSVSPDPSIPFDPEVTIVDSRNSNGSGGPTGYNASSYTSPTTRLKSKYWIEGPSSKTAKGLLVYLHGDNANELQNKWFFNKMVKLGDTHNLIPIAVFSPNNGSKWWGNQGSDYATVLHELIQEKALKAYNVDQNNVYFYGQSGGSQFVTKFFIPKYGHLYRGGVAPMCGGNTSGNIGFVDSRKVKEQIKFFFYTDSSDFLYSQAIATHKKFKGLGFDTTYESPNKYGHCKGDASAKMDEILKAWVSR